MTKGVQITLFILLAGIIGYIVFRKNKDNKYWEEKIQSYKTTSDLLTKRIDSINQSTLKKDSMLLSYMVSLDKTLYELNRESSKNRDTIRVYDKKLEEVMSEYCEYMQREHKQTPQGCNK
jgi:hypothetical protein